MKILPVGSIREADAYTIQHEPVASIDLMERAAAQCFHWLFGRIPVNRPVVVVAGSGNNGGDGLAVVRMLAEQGYQTHTFLIGKEEGLSPDCRINLERLKPLGSSQTLITQIEDPDQEIGLPNHRDAVILDALFGSGLTRPVAGPYAAIIREINRAEGMVVSIDVPSGLFIDQSLREFPDPVVVQADYTLTFAPPKLAFFFPENDRWIGEWVLLNIRLSEEFIRTVSVSNFMLTKGMVKPMLHSRNRYAHKGLFGHAILFCGANGKMGASVLAAHACLRAGTGLVTVRTPGCGVQILQTAIPEAMCSIDPDPEALSELPPLGSYSAAGIGPGVGKEQQTANLLKQLIQEQIPLVIDADAINILGNNPTWLAFLPKGCILTPHPKEFERIAGPSASDFDRHDRQRELSRKYDCYIVLKGAHTAVTTPSGNCYFNTTGNPGMATGGSGDVLTGIITGLLAQHYTPAEACLLGVYLHGLAGDLALAQTGFEALIAGDIIHHLGSAFQSLYGEL